MSEHENEFYNIGALVRTKRNQENGYVPSMSRWAYEARERCKMRTMKTERRRRSMNEQETVGRLNERMLVEI